MAVKLGINPIGWSNDDLRELGGETPLQGERRRVLGQPPLESLRQLVLETILVRAVGAAVEMRAHLGMGLGREPALLIVEQHQEDVVAVH